jgi:[histone H3]-lysine4 N-methyltransferase
VSFYNGVRLTPAEVDGRDWALNGNAITLGDDCVLDVPPPYDGTDHYCATLGHKANHAFANNAEYEIYEHPRFGLIKCLRTRRAVAAGEELTVAYGYDDALLGQLPLDSPLLEAPDWYRLLLRAHRAGQMPPP